MHITCRNECILKHDGQTFHTVADDRWGVRRIFNGSCTVIIPILQTRFSMSCSANLSNVTVKLSLRTFDLFWNSAPPWSPYLVSDIAAFKNVLSALLLSVSLKSIFASVNLSNYWAEISDLGSLEYCRLTFNLPLCFRVMRGFLDISLASFSFRWSTKLSRVETTII